MDRKYRQRGYQDSGRDHDRSEGRPKTRVENYGPRTPNLPGAHTVSRCGGCGVVLPPDFDPSGKCARCGFELHSCKQCAFFDTSSRFECAKPITTRIAQKDAKNGCSFYAPRTTVERQTSRGVSPSDPRKAFEALFKK